MPPDPFLELISSIRARVQAELDAQLPALAAQHDEAITAARATAEADAETRWSAILEAQKAEARQQLESAVAAARAEGPDTRGLLDAFRAIDAASTASGLLTAIATAAAAQSSRAALYVGPELEPWSASGTAGAATALREAMSTGRVIRKDEGGLAAPILLDGTAVAVLDVDAADPSEGWADTIGLVVRYGAAQLGSLTAMRTAHAQRWIARATSTTGSALQSSEQETDSTKDEGNGDSVQSARRYARLLVSEIKLYHETAVHEGRAQRDLSRRLAPEIDRARRLYEERVPATVADRGRHFHHELIHTLAGGDPGLLG